MAHVIGNGSQKSDKYACHPTGGRGKMVDYASFDGAIVIVRKENTRCVAGADDESRAQRQRAWL